MTGETSNYVYLLNSHFNLPSSHPFTEQIYCDHCALLCYAYHLLLGMPFIAFTLRSFCACRKTNADLPRSAALKFLGTSPLAFYRNNLSERDFPLLVRHARKITAMFGTTYCCEQLFSKMRITKAGNRAQLSDKSDSSALLFVHHAEHSLVVCSQKSQFHASH